MFQGPGEGLVSAVVWPIPHRRGLHIQKTASSYHRWGANVVSPHGTGWTKLSVGLGDPWCDGFTHVPAEASLWWCSHTVWAGAPGNMLLVAILFHIPEDESGLGNFFLMLRFRSAINSFSSMEGSRISREWRGNTESSPTPLHGQQKSLPRCLFQG